MRDICFRRSSVSGGIGIRITLPSLLGFSPRLALWMARSIAPIWVGSNGWAAISVGSGTDKVATWFNGIWVP